MSVLKEKYNPVLVPRGSSAPMWLVDGIEPEWILEDPMSNIKITPIESFQNQIYDTYRKMPKALFKALKLLP